MERGPIRPPSEAASLLLRVTRNCPWNRCAFCHTYHGSTFSLRPVAEIINDINLAEEIAGRLRNTSLAMGSGGSMTQAVVDRLCTEGEFAGESVRAVASWLYQGGESVFLQDADTLIMKTADLVRVLSRIREKLPSVRQITTYGRSSTVARKPAEELQQLHAAGLTRIHMGLESGYDPILQFMKKGTTAALHAEAGRRIQAAGISLCVYVMPGLGGVRWSTEHAEETARVINRINPDVIRLRSLHVVEGSELFTMMQQGTFTPLGEEEIVKEIGRFIEHLEGITSTLVSDHVLNLLEEVQGTFPRDKPRLLETIAGFFALPPEERLVFRLGRRKGIYRKLSDLADRGTYLWLKSIIDQYPADNPEQLEGDLREIMNSFI